MADELRVLELIWEIWVQLFHGLPHSHTIAAGAAIAMVVLIGALIRAIMGQPDRS